MSSVNQNQSNEFYSKKSQHRYQKQGTQNELNADLKSSLTPLKLNPGSNSQSRENISESQEQIKVMNTVDYTNFNSQHLSQKSVPHSDISSPERPIEVDIRHWQRKIEDTAQTSQVDLLAVSNNSRIYNNQPLKNVVSQKYFSHEKGKQSKRNLLDRKLSSSMELSKVQSQSNKTFQEAYQKSCAPHPVIPEVYIDDGRIQKRIKNQSSQIILNKLVRSSFIAKTHFKHRSSDFSPSRFSTETVMRGGGGQKLLKERQSFPTNVLGNVMRYSSIPQRKNKNLAEMAQDSILKLAQIQQTRLQTEQSPQKSSYPLQQKAVVIEGYGSNYKNLKYDLPSNKPQTDKKSSEPERQIPNKIQQTKDFITRNISGLPEIAHKKMGGNINITVDHDTQRLRLLKQLSLKENKKLNKIQLAELKGKDTVQCLRANIKWNANEFLIKAKSALSGNAKNSRELEIVRHYVDKFFTESDELNQYKQLSNEDREIVHRREYFKMTKEAELNDEASFLKKNLGNYIADHLRALKKYRQDPNRLALNHKQTIIAKRMAKKQTTMVSNDFGSSNLDQEKEIYGRDSAVNVQKAQEGAMRLFKKMKFEDQLKTLAQYQNDLVKKLDDINTVQKLYKHEEEDFELNGGSSQDVLNRQQLRMQQKLEDAMYTSDLYFKYQNSINQYLKEQGAEKTSIEAIEGLKKNLTSKDQKFEQQQQIESNSRRMSQDELEPSTLNNLLPQTLFGTINENEASRTFYPSNGTIQFDKSYFNRQNSEAGHKIIPIPKLSIDETSEGTTVGEQSQYVQDKKAKKHIADSIIRQTKFQQEFILQVNNDQQKHQKNYAKAQEQFKKISDQHKKEEELLKQRQSHYLRKNILVSARKPESTDLASSQKLNFLGRIRRNTLGMLAALSFANDFAIDRKQAKLMKEQLMTALGNKKDLNASQDEYENEDLNKAENHAQAEGHGLFIDEVIREGSVPLPIFNKIENKMLFLDNYQLDNQNLSALSQVLQTFVPNSLQKLILRSNTIDDKSLANIIIKLSELKNGGLKVLALIRNKFDQETQEAFTRHYFTNTDALSNLKKFYIIDPLSKAGSYHSLVNGIRINATQFTQLKSLCLQKLQMTRADIVAITDVVLKVPTLQNLNLADNNLTPSDLAHLFSQMTPLNQSIQYLNLSWNHARCQSKTEQADFDNQFATFVRYSQSLQHLDVSGMRFKPASMEQFCVKGMRKSKTLLSVHMNGNFNQEGLLDQTRKWLKVYRVNKRARSNMNEEQWQSSSEVPQFMLDSHLGIKKHVAQNFGSDQVMNVVLRKQKKKQETLSQIMQNNEQYKVSDSVVFQRFLGHLEIINGHRWEEVDGNDCYICKKWAYCLFFWDQSIGNQSEFYQSTDRDLLNHLNLSKSRFCTSYISIESTRQVFPMLGINEFLSRLEDNMAHFEGNNIQDYQTKERAEGIKKLSNHLTDFEKNPLQSCQIGNVQSNTTVGLKWITLMLKQGILEHKQPQGMTKDLINLYKRSEQSGDLRVCAAYLPAKQTTIIVQSQEKRGKSYFMGCHPTPQHKSLTFNNMKPMKLVYRCIPSQVGFQKQQSLFAGFVDENKETLIQQQFDYDWSQMKLDDIVPDFKELENIKEMFRDYYSDLLLIYLFQISCDAFPSTNWIEFSHYCTEWNLIETGSLSTTEAEIYQIFLKMVLKPGEAECDSQLKINRPQFMEMLVRLAAYKYFQKYLTVNVQDAYAKIMTDVMMPHARLYPFDLEDWRIEFLYSKEVHNVYSANEDSLTLLFQTYAQSETLPFQQALGMILDSQIDLHEDKITMAFAFSKKRIISEEEETLTYTQMNMLEFYEFLGRIAFLENPDPQKSFAAKIYRLFQLLFRTIGIKQVKEVVQTDLNDSESDYEDNFAEEYLAKRYPEQIYAGFGLTCKL